jgi:Rieske Fe-S protein
MTNEEEQPTPDAAASESSDVSRRSTIGYLAIAGAVLGTGGGAYMYLGGGSGKSPVGEKLPEEKIELERPEDGRVALPLADHPSLQEDKSAMVLNIGKRPTTKILLWRESADNYIALSQVCTHSGCGVHLYEKAVFCSCHASTFTKDGEVTEGPASKPLKQYNVALEGAAVVIELGESA